MIFIISRLVDHLESGKPLISTKTKVALALVLVPAITFGALWVAAEKVSTAGMALAKGVSETIKKPFYLISSPFRGKEVPEEMREHVLSKQEVKEFTESVRKEVEMDPSKLYVAVTGLSSEGKERASMVIEIAKEKTVNQILQICKKKWALKKTESLQLFCNHSLLTLDTPLAELSRNELGIVEVELSRLETFG